jgi:two-component system sensor histidine kinase DegS
MADSTAWPKAVLVQEEERYRLARALGNGPAQLLANSVLEIESSLSLWDADPAAARAGLVALLDELKLGVVQIRELIGDLQPPLLAELGLAASVSKYAEGFLKRTGIALSLSGWEALSERLPATMEIAIFRIIQEALENVRNHSKATHVRLALECTNEQLVVTIADNGQGFCIEEGVAASGRHLGLVAMHDRADFLGGQLQVFSEPSRGANVVLTVPLRGRTA